MPHQRTERWKWKWAWRIALCLVLGAVINVGVAWGCAAWSKISTSSLQSQLDRLLSGESAARPVWANGTDGMLFQATDVYGFGFGKWRGAWGSTAIVGPVYREVWPTADIRRDQGGFVSTTVTGWPCYAMKQEDWGVNTPNGPGTVDVGVIRGGISLGSSLVIRGRSLPLMPLFPGFAVNTLLYGALLMTPFVPGAIRRWRRVRRGWCRGCGYDIAGLTTCPECGTQKKATAR